MEYALANRASSDSGVRRPQPYALERNNKATSGVQRFAQSVMTDSVRYQFDRGKIEVPEKYRYRRVPRRDSFAIIEAFWANCIIANAAPEYCAEWFHRSLERANTTFSHSNPRLKTQQLRFYDVAAIRPNGFNRAANTSPHKAVWIPRKRHVECTNLTSDLLKRSVIGSRSRSS